MADSNTYQARFLHGSPRFIDYTPGSAVSAGDVVVLGDTPYVAHDDIAANEKGALAAGGGVYEVTPAAAVANGGEPIWWDDTNNQGTETATSNTHLGSSVGASYSSDTKLAVLHNPQSVTGAIV